MNIVEIDMRAGAPKAVIAFRFEGQRSPFSKQSFGPGFDLLAKLVFRRTARAIAGFRTVPADQSQANALCAAIGEALQFERVAIHRDHISDRGADTTRAGFGAEIVGLRRSIIGAASCEEEGDGQDRDDAHAAT